MAVLDSVLVVEHGKLRLLLFSELHGKRVFYAENHVDYAGFCETGFNNAEDVFAQIQELYKTGEERYGQIAEVSTIIIPGVFYTYSTDEASVNVRDGVVGQKDVDAAMEECGAPLPGYEISEVIPISYKTYAGSATPNPIGIRTDKLTLNASVGYLKLSIKELFDNAAKRIGRKFNYISYCLAAVKTNNPPTPSEQEKIAIILSDGHFDVVHYIGNIPIRVASELLGSSYVTEAVSDELGLSEEISEKILRDINLNLSDDYSGNYIVDGKEYSCRAVNGIVRQMLEYYAGEAAKIINDMNVSQETRFYLTGSDLCEKRGVIGIFILKLGYVVQLLRSESLNLLGCGNYIATYGERIDSKDKDGKSRKIFKAKWRKN